MKFLLHIPCSQTALISRPGPNFFVKLSRGPGRLPIAWPFSNDIFPYHVDLDNAALDPTAVLAHDAPTAEHGDHSAVVSAAVINRHTCQT